MFRLNIRSGVMVALVVLAATDNTLAVSEISQRRQELNKEENILNYESAAGFENIRGRARLDDYIRIGLSNNLSLRAEFHKWEASFMDISREFSLPDPQFTFTDYIEEVETRVGPQQRAFSLQQRVPVPDKLWIRRSKAFKASEEAYYNFQKKKLDIVSSITDAYYEYVYLSKAVILTEENLKLLRNFESVAQSKYRSSMVKNQDLLKVQVELGRIENELLSLKDMQRPVVARLNALLNLPENTVLPLPDELLEDIVIEEKYEYIESLYAVVIKDNPELSALFNRVEKDKDSLRLAKRDYFPDLTFGVTKIDTADAMNPATADSGKDPLMVSFSVNVPIWANRLDANVQKTKAELKSSESLLDAKKQELFSRLALIHYKLRDSLRQSRLYKDSLLPKADQALNAIQSGYEGGEADFLSLIDAQRVLLDFQLAYYRHTADFYQRLSELRSLLGQIKTDDE